MMAWACFKYEQHSGQGCSGGDTGPCSCVMPAGVLGPAGSQALQIVTTADLQAAAVWLRQQVVRG